MSETTTTGNKKTVKCTPSVMRTCKYDGGYNSCSWRYCDYMSMTGHRRGCSPKSCDKYEKKKSK